MQKNQLDWDAKSYLRLNVT